MFEILLSFLVSALKKTTKCGIFSAGAGNQTRLSVIKRKGPGISPGYFQKK